jgi:hypothetical protein
MMSSTSRRIVTFATSFLLLSVGCFAQAPSESPEPIVDPIGGPIGPIKPIGSLAPDLSGTLSGVTLKPTASGKFLRVKGKLMILNSGFTTAKKVTASVYLSPDKTLTSTEQPLVVLDVATFFNGDGKVRAHATVTIPLSEKVRALLAPALSGQYVIIVLAGSNVPKDLSTPIVYGPLPKVP